MRYTAVFLFLLAALTIRFLIWTPVTDLLDVNKCPACYGTSLCSAFASGMITLDTSTWSAVIFNAFGSKNVFFGKYLQSKVVLKKLGDSAELALLDDLICKGADECEVGEALQQHSDLLERLEKQVTDTFSSCLLLCPSASKLQELIDQYDEPQQNRTVALMNVWTVVSVNPEPLVLQVLREEDGWPVARYLGACGRVVVEEYVGEMLYKYHSAPWLQRAHLALQLLVAALNFTLSHPEFHFYLTDVSPDNIAVDAAGSIRFIDLENIVVVDKSTTHSDAPVTWDSMHVSEVFDCHGDGCFAFSSADLCAHGLSDHNVYAVCQTLLHPQYAPSSLPGGLLHHPPASHAHVLQLVRDCVESTDRFSVAHRLIQALLV